MPWLHSRRLLRAAVSWFVLILVALGLMEACLQAATAIYPPARQLLFAESVPRLIPDIGLGQKGNPASAELDARGFRNERAIPSADIVAIGDSHTFGASVERGQAWPAQLASGLGCSVYNMGTDGYGPLQYSAVAEQAMQLSPKIAIVAIYFGNDFFDNISIALESPRFRDWISPEDLPMLQEAEKRDPLARKVDFFFALRDAAHPAQPGIRSWMSSHVALWAVLRDVKNVAASLIRSDRSIMSDDFDAAVAGLSPRHLEFASVFQGAGWRTILTSRYRALAEDDSSLQIRAGYRLTYRAIDAMVRTFSAYNVRPLFVLLPTKENVFAPRVADKSAHRDLARLANHEDRYRAELAAYFNEKGIAFLDATPALRAASRQPYFANADGHPNRAGHRIIAEAIQAKIGQCGN